MINYECENNHKYYVVDGVVDFRTREIDGELWSLYLRNYDHYLKKCKGPGNPNYKRGLNQADVIWEHFEKLRPRVILDIAGGMGGGIKQQIKRINWPVTIIMVDISHRILAWDKIYYSTEWKNPYVEMIYLACDGANMPILDNSVDIVFSNIGYESMQDKMMSGFREAFRVLKPGGHTIYTKVLIDGNENSQKWINLMLARGWDWRKKMFVLEKWLEICEQYGFTDNESVKIYGELPAPDTGKFPFENEIAQWMAEYVISSKKPV